jgi:molecular chaperone DnaK
VPQIEVSFDIDANGIVNVKAKDLGTGKEQSITIKNDTGLSEDDIERMVKEAEENAEADKALKEAADLKNEADQLVFQTRKAITDLGEGVTDSEKEDAEAKIKAVEDALKSDDLDQIKTAKEALEATAQELATKAYQKAQEAQQAEGAADQANDTNANGKADDDNVVDADFEEVD